MLQSASSKISKIIGVQLLGFLFEINFENIVIDLPRFVITVPVQDKLGPIFTDLINLPRFVITVSVKNEPDLIFTNLKWSLQLPCFRNISFWQMI